MTDFSYKSVDTVGLDTLSVIESANHFNRWMYDEIRPFLSGTILEIGSGTGNISQYAAEDGFTISLSDIRENYRDILKQKFAGSEHVKEVIALDIVDPDFDTKYKSYFGTFDSIFALNVVEHIKDDRLALQNCKKLLRENGNLIILVPAFQALYNEFDRQLEHYRRYTVASLKKIFPTAVAIVHTQYFNFIGMAGWFFSGAILKKQTIPGGQMKLYNTLIRGLKYLDNLFFHKAGLSVIVVGKVNGEQQ